MVWQERGKRGVNCGRTVRRNSSTSYHGNNRQTGVILKYEENAGNYSSSTKNNLLQDRYDLTDGLHMPYVPHRQNTLLEFSLGKRKRWLLRDLVKERQVIDDENDCIHQDEGEQFDDIRVSFHERHIMPFTKRYSADCVSYYNDHDGEKSPKGHYSYYSDLNRESSSTKPAEIGYEICSPPPTGTWPHFSEKQERGFRFWDLQGKKAKCKCKGMKKRDRFGLKNDKDLHTAIKYPKSRKNDADYCKVKVVSKKDFDLVNNNMNTASRKAGCMVTIEDALAHSAKKHHNPKTVQSLQNFSTSKESAKGCAIYVENSSVEAASTVVTQESQKHFIDAQHKANVNVDVEGLQASKLASQWGECYQEGAVLPRMFAINITSLLPVKLQANSDTNVLFEFPNQSVASTTQAAMTVSLIHASIGKDSKLEDTAIDFVKYIERISCYGTKLLEVKDVVEAGVQCVEVAHLMQDEVQQPRATHVGGRRNLHLLNKTYGWKSEAFSLEDAQHQIKELLQIEGKISAKCPVPPESFGWTMLSMECEICYATIEDNSVTTLHECGHSFCNDCWVNHLVTQVSQGVECIKCPGYDCDSDVDNLIMLSQTPKLYERCLNTVITKHLETSSNWKWCPGKHCQKLVKAVQHDSNNKAMTVLCSCSTTWCYKCQEKAHWPATCEESKAFFKRSGYAEYLQEKESQELISSVMVKNCPRCNYPIEKFMGCQFMSCVLCHSHFCWNCLTEANYGHTCEKKPDDDLTLVLLNTRNKRYHVQKYVQVLIENNKASSPGMMYVKQRRLEKLKMTQTKGIYTASESRMTQFMESVVDSQVFNNVEQAVQFEYQARIVLEGLTQKAAVTRSAKGRTASMKMSKLVFITGRIDSILREPGLLDKHDRLGLLERLVEIGMKCIASLKNFV